jgi:hypothetical protein
MSSAGGRDKGQSKTGRAARLAATTERIAAVASGAYEPPMPGSRKTVSTAIPKLTASRTQTRIT